MSIKTEDFRRGTNGPRVSMRFQPSSAELSFFVSSLQLRVKESVLKLLKDTKEGVEFQIHITRKVPDGFSRNLAFSDEFESALKTVVEEATAAIVAAPSVPAGVALVAAVPDEAKEAAETVTHSTEQAPALIDTQTLPTFESIKSEILKKLWDSSPDFTLFREDISYLPNLVDIDETKKEFIKGNGTVGAGNYLKSADVKLEDILSEDDRERASAISTATAKINSQLSTYWSQTLGKKGKIKLELDFQRYRPDHPTSPGAAYLRFWISEGDGEKLHPSQRSRGTRWYVSFFLYLMASQKMSASRVLLLDEPGAYLHAIAQEDVLRLISKLSAEIPIVYSTHSPYLIDKKIERIIAVERDVANEQGNTIIRSGLLLAASSSLTLAPILSIMGVDLSKQNAIQRDGNVLLEENSAYFYFLAFSKLLGIGDGLSFVACNGADNVKSIVDLFVAWRLKFAIALDDDDKGKIVARFIKKKWHLDDTGAEDKILMLTGFSGIEDAFECNDFKLLIPDGMVFPEDKKNTEVVDILKLSKPVLALDFYSKVNAGVFDVGMISELTKERFRSWITALEKSSRA